MCFAALSQYERLIINVFCSTEPIWKVHMLIVEWLMDSFNLGISTSSEELFLLGRGCDQAGIFTCGLQSNKC